MPDEHVTLEACRRTHDAVDCRLAKIEKRSEQGVKLQLANLAGVIGLLGTVLGTLIVGVILYALQAG